MDANPIKLPPNFDVRGATAASEWKFWRCMFEDYLIGIGQDEASDRVKLSLLRNMMGPESAKVIQTLKLTKSELENYNKVIEEIGKYVNPKKNELFERYRFNERKQQQGETFENFYSALRQLMANCDFSSNKEALEDQLLRDRIVQGITDKNLQEILLRTDELTLDKVTKLCRASEISKNQVKEMIPVIEVDAAKINNKKKTEEFHCKRCQKRHGPRQCPAFGKKCARCGILNHLAISCRVKNIQEVKIQKTTDSDSDDSLFCGEVITSAGKVKEWYDYIKIGGKTVKCKLDTGAEVSVLPKKIFDELYGDQSSKLYSDGSTIESFQGANVNHYGMINLECKYKDRTCYENFVVVDNKRMLLGLPGCTALNLVRRVDEVEIHGRKEEFIKDNIKVFEGIGKLPGPLREKAIKMLNTIERNPPRFCVYGMWHVDARLLLNMFSIITNAFVIILQFAFT